MNALKSLTFWLYVLLAVFTSLNVIATSDEAKEIIGKVTLFYAKGFIAVIGAALLAAKMTLSKPEPPPPTPDLKDKT